MLSRSLQSGDTYACAVIPARHPETGAAVYYAVTPGGESLPMTSAMLDALSRSGTRLSGVASCYITAPGGQPDPVSAPDDPVARLEVLTVIRDPEGELISHTLARVSATDRADCSLVVSCAERPAGWPP